MKKTFLTLLTFCALTAAAQSEIVVGDMNDDDQLSVGDVTALTDAIVHPERQRSISLKCDPNASDPAAIAGNWTLSGQPSLWLLADGSVKASAVEGAKTFEYYPYSRMLLLLDGSGSILRDYLVLRMKDSVLVLQELSGPCVKYDFVQLVESITLSVKSLVLDVNESVKLTATVLPADADNPSYTWSSSNEDVAEVTRNGVVYTNGYGRCTITATANDGSGVKAECVIVVEKPHEYVDLGLPSGTLWATCNVGADNPEDYGYYFAWGEVEPKSTYNWSTYKWMKEGYSDGKGCNKYTYADGQTSGCWYNNGTFVGDNKPVLDLEDDAAYMNWGEGWRMPSTAQQDELRDTNNCTWTWTTVNGKKGCMVESKHNGSSLFLPAAGYRNVGSLDDAGSWGYYWSRSLRTSYSEYANYLYFNSSNVGWGHYRYRYYGFPVRPVRLSASE